MGLFDSFIADVSNSFNSATSQVGNNINQTLANATGVDNISNRLNRALRGTADSLDTIGQNAGMKMEKQGQRFLNGLSPILKGNFNNLGGDILSLASIIIDANTNQTNSLGGQTGGERVAIENANAAQDAQQKDLVDAEQKRIDSYTNDLNARTSLRSSRPGKSITLLGNRPNKTLLG